MQSNYISLDLLEKLDSGEVIEGYVSSVYNTLFTVLGSEGELIYFLNNKKYMSPMSVVLEDFGSFKDFNLTQDTKVLINKTNILIDSHKIEIELTGAKSWNPKMELLGLFTDENIIEKNLLITEESVYKHGKYEGFAPLIFSIGEYIEELKSLSSFKVHNNLYSSFIFAKIIDFIHDLLNNEGRDSSKLASEFLGFGPGLTPSSDDFLCGFMSALTHLSEYYDLDLEKIVRFNSQLLGDVELDKSEISHDLLTHYSKGKSQKMIKNLINGMLYEKDEEAMIKLVRESISFGDISGTDMVCGVYIGIRLIRCENFKENYI